MATITEGTERAALLRYLDLCNDASDLVNRYLDLGALVIGQTLLSKAYEALACANLPQAWRGPEPEKPAAAAPPDEADAADAVRADHD